MPKILLTGASGFLGQCLLEFAPDDVQVFLQHNRHAPPNKKGWQSLPMDFCNPHFPLSKWGQFDVIIHLAAITNIDACQENPVVAQLVNIQATRLLSALAQQHNSRLILASTDIVFDGKTGQRNESHPVSPINYYGTTKSEAERLVRGMLKNHVIARLPVMYGPDRGSAPNFAAKMIESLKQGKRVPCFVDQVRNTSYANDIAKALWELAFHEFTGTLHCAADQPLSRYDFALKTCQLLNLDASLVVATHSGDIPFKAPRPKDCSLDVSLAKQILRTPLRPLEQTIHEFTPA